MRIAHRAKTHWKTFKKGFLNAIDIANNCNTGCSARLAFLDGEDLYKQIRQRPKGIWYDDGGGVPNSYSYTAETSVVGCAWWTSPKGILTANVVGDRTRAKSAPHGFVGLTNPFPSDDPWEATFPGRALKKNRLIRDRTDNLIKARGEQGSDRMNIWRPIYSALAPEGFLVKDHLTRPKVGCIIVTDSVTGLRTHITVPPRFVNSKTKAYHKAEAFGLEEFGKAERGRVVAALEYNQNLEV
jgi:hypothetical protein